MRLIEPVYSFSPKQERIIEFKGYNKKSVIEDGEMRDMYNLASDEYPCLYQRKSRGIYSDSYVDPTAMIVKDKKLAVISDGKFYYDETWYPALLLSEETAMVAINTKICFFPEKIYFDVKSKKTGSLAAKVSIGSTTVTVTTSHMTVPSSVTTNFDDAFKTGDAVQVVAKGDGAEDLNISAVIEGVTENTIIFPEETFISLIAEGETEKKITVESMTVDRSCPNLDFVMESNNRLWGVCNDDNTIYACKLGDPTNWTYFQNTSLDSYYAEQGTDGEWTGCAAYSTHLLFFKEDCIHKLYGSKPSTYQIETAKCHALEKGSNKSVAIINETVFYKSRLGIMAYSGGIPALISDNFGTERYVDVISGTDGIKYYASVMRNGKPELCVYDVEKGLWHKEDNVRVRDFAYHNGKLIYVNDDDGVMYEMASDNPMASERDITWRAELGPFDEFIEDKKVYSKMKMRLRLEDMSELAVYIKMDDGDWEQLQHINAEKSRSMLIPMVPRRCDKFAIRFIGKGYCKIESLVREYRLGTIRKDV